MNYFGRSLSHSLGRCPTITLFYYELKAKWSTKYVLVSLWQDITDHVYDINHRSFIRSRMVYSDPSLSNPVADRGSNIDPFTNKINWD